MQQKKDETPRRAYEKPKLRIIALVAEEILAVGCKTSPVSLGRGAPGQCTNPTCSVSYGS